jgi:anti-repressor protein
MQQINNNNGRQIMNNLKIFNNEEYGDQQEWFFKNHRIRTIMINGILWWILKDVCDALGIANPSQTADRLDDDERAMFNIGRQGDINIINESGLYKVILRSNKPEAKNFTRWVTHEVLPSIRKHGSYITASKVEEILNDPDAWIKLLTTLKEERTAKKRLQIQVENDKPKIIFSDAVSVSDSSLLIGELAKILRGNGIEIGQNRLFERLRQDGFLIRRNGSDYNMPTQKAMELELFQIKETAITHSDGHVTISKTTKVTGKGQQYFVNYFLNEKGDENARN